MGEIVVFAYRLTNDTGFAPCVENNLFSLACCKGGRILKNNPVHCGLRHTIGEFFKEKNGTTEVYLLGIYKNTLLFYAKINNVYSMSEYFGSNISNNRTDNIYDIDKTAFCGLKRNNLLPNVHPKIDPKTNLENPQIKKDICGDYVLCSNEFSYWGANSKIIEDQSILDILPKHQECFPKRPYTSDKFSTIHKYVQEHGGYDHRKLAEPHDPIINDKRKGCNQK